VNALAGAPAARGQVCGAKSLACRAVPRAFRGHDLPGRPERRDPRAAAAGAVTRDPDVPPARARVSTAPRVTDGRLWARPPVLVRPVSGGQAVQRAARRDHRSRARRVPAAPPEAAPVSTGPRASGRQHSARCPVRGRPHAGGSRDRRDPEPSRAASPGMSFGRTTTGPARPEHRSRPEPTDFARQHPLCHFRRQRNEEVCRDPP
jgi:hypothetical protein